MARCSCARALPCYKRRLMGVLKMAPSDCEFFQSVLTAGAIISGFCGSFLVFRIQREAEYYRVPGKHWNQQHFTPSSFWFLTREPQQPRQSHNPPPVSERVTFALPCPTASRYSFHPTTTEPCYSLKRPTNSRRVYLSNLRH